MFYLNGILKNTTSKRLRFCFAFLFCCCTLYTYKGVKQPRFIPTFQTFLKKF
nr:MAG TPA: hypothetical protein [Siphoviridae sp. ctHdl3]